MNSEGAVKSERHFSVGDIMELYGVSRAYVYKLASIHRWRRMRLFGGKVVYFWADVDRVLGGGEADPDV